MSKVLYKIRTPTFRACSITLLFWSFVRLLQEAGAQCVAHVESNCSQVLEYQNLLRVYIDMFGCGYEREDGSMYSTPRGGEYDYMVRLVYSCRVYIAFLLFG